MMGSLCVWGGGGCVAYDGHFYGTFAKQGLLNVSLRVVLFTAALCETAIAPDLTPW